MKTLRARLFLVMGIILLFVALVNYFLPVFMVKKEVKQSGDDLTQVYEEYETKLSKLTSFILSSQVASSASQLIGVAEMVTAASDKIQDDIPSTLILASRIASFDPEIAFVQIEEQDNTILVAPMDTTLYHPEWAPFDNEKLWIRIPGKEEIFVATPSNAKKPEYYHLTKPTELQKNQIPNLPDFTLQTNRPSTFPQSAGELYNYLLEAETEWIEKMNLIIHMATLKTDQPTLPIVGVSKKDSGFATVLAEEAFLFPTEVNPSSHPPFTPYLAERVTLHGKDYEIASYFELPKPQLRKITIGFSISSLIQKLAQLGRKPLLLYNDNKFLQGYSSTGEIIHSSEISQENPQLINYKGVAYVPSPISTKTATLVLLNPESEALAVPQSMQRLGQKLTTNISTSLLIAALVSLSIALLILTKISKKFTKPIAQLAHVSEEIGHGKYEGLDLPPIDKRDDEIAVLVHSFQNMLGSLRDREKIRGVLNKVVSKEVAEEILKKDIELGGEERNVTILFSDIRGFTHLSEHIEPKLLITELNQYMTQMCRIIDQTKGVVDKFVGDEIMALYGAPLSLENPPHHAIQAAILMMQELREWNQKRQKEGKFTFEIGIGIHSGKVLAGNMGAESRLNYTVIGANVNLASRLCSHAKPGQILVSESTWKSDEISQKFQFLKLDPIELKGIDHKVTTYEVKY